ncbi:MAG: ribosomal RNA small subunit methyltransferase A [Candidatus Kapaibacterium sp.]|nr:MAG: ribosomal RNA small subunit methyltransferase A [Candidatus Kapabacteria bacterium]
MRFPSDPRVISPRRRLSQNFLVNPTIAARIAAAVEAQPGDVVIEIGAGTGALTQHLLALPVQEVIAIEVDRRAIEQLQKAFSSCPTLRIVEANVLDLRLEGLGIVRTMPARVVGNIPYHLTGPILFWLYEQAKSLRRIVLMVQKEVATRIVARPGTKAYGILSVATALIATQARILFDVPPGAFYPQPQVTSAVVAIECNGSSLVDPQHAQTMALTKVAFNQRRKKLRNALARFLQQHCGTQWEQLAALPVMGRRAEELSPQELAALASDVYRFAKSEWQP